MEDRREIILTSDASDSQFTAITWDTHSGTALMKYKGGGATSAHCIAFVGNDYLLCAEKTKPLIHVWPLNSQEKSRHIERIVTPGCVNALCVSPKNNYCVIAVGEKLYIWDIMGGQLLTVNTRHYRSITCVKFTDDGSHFISCGQDGLVIVWPLVYLVSYHASELMTQMGDGQPEPRYTFSDHSLPVTDMYVGKGGIQALVVTVSGDQTCKLYSLSDGYLLVSIVFNGPLSAVTMSVNELGVFVGSLSGEIYHFEMQHQPRTLDYHVTREQLSQKYLGHLKAITSLSASLDGYRLISGSVDQKVIIWDIKSRQCLKVIKFKGPVTNAFFIFPPKHFSSHKFNPSTVIKSFKRKNEMDEGYVTVFTKNDFEEKEMHYKKSPIRIPASENVDKRGDEVDVSHLKEVNKKLYSFAVNEVLKMQLK